MAEPAKARNTVSFIIENVKELFTDDSKHKCLTKALQKWTENGFTLWYAWMASHARAGGASTRIRVFFQFIPTKWAGILRREPL